VLFLEKELVGSFSVKKNFVFSLNLFDKLMMLVFSLWLGSVQVFTDDKLEICGPLNFGFNP